MNTGRSCHYL